MKRRGSHGGALELLRLRDVLTRQWLAVLLLVSSGARVGAQSPVQVSSSSLPDFPTSIETAEHTIGITAVRGLSHPWSLAFLPNGDILVTERDAGELRIVQDGVLNPQPISGVPAVANPRFGGLMEVILHPDFAENSLVYLSYTKAVGEGTHTAAVARGRLDGTALVEVDELFVANVAFQGPGAGIPMVFDPQGYLYVGVGGGLATMMSGSFEGEPAQRLDSHAGKILRLRDDGTVPRDNPFIGQPDRLAEIWSYGHRNMLGLTIHPETGELWESENGPNGGDEINIIEKGRNYGWPLVTYGRDYDGSRISESPYQEGLEAPYVVWLPSIAPTGLTFYTGGPLEDWQRNLFVGSLQVGAISGTGHLQRIVFNDNWEEVQREALLSGWGLRVRNVRQGPDGLLYLLTEQSPRGESEGMLLKIERFP